ncbi:MAG: hypothetical protein OEY94_07175 [Alphaproteobacteria bacterium]|nr:hypothetical protein [Alphaproteobacteria bacterium]
MINMLLIVKTAIAYFAFPAKFDRVVIGILQYHLNYTMKTKREHFNVKTCEKGNALIYVLIAIVLFAGLGFTLARQSNNAGTTELDEAKAELLADQIIAYAQQAQNSIDQMLFSGSKINDLVFTLPSEAGFNTAPLQHKIYHPSAGGFIPSPMPAQMVNEVSTTPNAGWYLGRFNNVEWTPSTNMDVILTGHQISRAICEKINFKITGSTTIPAIVGDLRTFLIDDANYVGTNADFTTIECAACENYKTMCVSNAGATYFTYYAIIADQ